MRTSPKRFLIGKLALVSALLSACGTQLAPPTTSAQVPAAQPAQIITVSLKAGVTAARLLAAYPGGQLLAFHPDEGYAMLAVSEAGAKLSAQVAAVTSVEANITVETDTADAQGNDAWANGNNAWANGYTAWANGATSTINTTFAENQAAWTKLELGYGQKLVPEMGRGVKVAVLDTGIDLNHPALLGKLDTPNAKDYLDGDTVPQDTPDPSGSNKAYGHGTAVAGIVLQISPNVTILPMRVLSANGQGSLANIIVAINDSVARGAKVINLSLGSLINSAALNSAINSAIKAGVTVVAASGNSGKEGLNYPAQNCLNTLTSLGGGLISVGSVDLNLKKSSFSTYGLALAITAPGESIVTLFPGSQRVAATGTSFATPIVTGAVALAYSAGATNVAQMQTNLQTSVIPNADTIFNSLLGKGTVNIGRFLHTYR